MALPKIPGFRRASAKETRELSKLRWVRDDELSSGSRSEARVLPDGRVLLWIADGESAALYPSREALAQRLRELDAMPKGPIDHTLTLLPPIDDFLRDVETHAKSLGARIKVPDQALDGTVTSLDAVDEALKRIPWAKRQVHDLVTPLVAYVGEVLRRASGGRWVKPASEPVYDAAKWGSLRPSKGSQNEPMIQASNGQGFQPFAIVFVPMVEPSKRMPLRDAVGARLRPSPTRAGSRGSGVLGSVFD
jgi:hypothetical protein